MSATNPPTRFPPLTSHWTRTGTTEATTKAASSSPVDPVTLLHGLGADELLEHAREAYLTIHEA